MGADIVQRTNENLQYYFDKSNEPILVINSGNSISVETERADGMYLSRQNSVFRDHDHVMQVRSNPVTGPICDRANIYKWRNAWRPVGRKNIGHHMWR